MSESEQQLAKLIEKCKSNGMPSKQQQGTYVCILRAVQTSMLVLPRSNNFRPSSKQELKSVLSPVVVVNKTIDV
jgi:hypothetical protein